MERNEKQFRALIERDTSGLGWTVARFAFQPRECWPAMIRLRIAGEANGVFFRSSLFADGEGGFLILISRSLQRTAKIRVGDAAEFRLWADLEPRPAELPDAFAAILDDEPAVRTWYDALSESIRREIGKWLLGVKSEEAQGRRAMQMAERLLATMEAEEQLPPLIATALKRRPRARAGWQQMTASQRRSQLLGVFHYQAPDARKRRVEKLCDIAEARAAAATERLTSGRSSPGER